MGYSLKTQCDSKQYFSISRIDPECMKEYGINLSPRELANLARHSVPFNTIETGQSSPNGFRRETKIYRYADFVEVKHDTV